MITSRPSALIGRHHHASSGHKTKMKFILPQRWRENTFGLMFLHHAFASKGKKANSFNQPG